MEHTFSTAHAAALMMFAASIVATAGIVSKDKDTLTLVILNTMIKEKFRQFNRSMTGTLNSMVKVFNENSSTSWHNDYQLQTRLMGFRHMSPSETLDTLCNETLNQRPNVLMYVEDEESKPGLIQYLMHVVEFVGLPVMVAVGESASLLQPSVDSSVLQLTPSIYHRCQAALSLLRRYNWREFAVVTGTMPGSDYFVNVLRDLVDRAVKDAWYEIVIAVHVEVEDKADLKNKLTLLYKSDARIILLFATTKESAEILDVAKRLEMTGKEFIWIVYLTGNLTSAVKPSFHDGMFGIDFAPWFRSTNDPQEIMKAGVMLWARAFDAFYRDAKANEVQLRNVTFKPNEFKCAPDYQHTKWHDGQHLLRYIKNTSYSANRNTVFAFNDDGTQTEPEIIIRNLRMGGWKEIGKWRPSTGVITQDVMWPGGATSPPRGRPDKSHLRIVTMQELPYVIYSELDQETKLCPPQSLKCRVNNRGQYNATDNSTSHYQCCSGLCMDLLKMLSEKIGLEFELFEVPDKKWGAYDKDKKEWNGIIKTLLNGDADMAVTSLKITPERSKEIDFSVPFLETGITIIVPVRDGVISPTAFLEPYDFASWCLILIFSVHASGAALFLVEWLSPNGLDRGLKPIREHKFSLFRAFWLIWAMLFGAAVKVDTPRGVASRFLTSVWALFAVVFTASYTANLAAFMITKEDYDKLIGIQDPRLTSPRTQRPEFKYATVPDGSTETNLKNNYPTMYEYMKSNKLNKPNAPEGVQAVKDGFLNAFIYDATVLEYLASHDDSCKLKTVGKWYAMTGYGIGFPKGSRWIDKVNRYMVQFQYEGEMERLQKFWLAGVCKKSENSKGESSVPLEILNFTSAFILLACGMVLVGFLVAVEHLYFKFFRRKLRKWDQRGCCSLVSLSVGKSLTFENTVREAMELQKNYKCKNPICETQVWKLRHELDMAQLNIQRLQRAVRRNRLSPNETQRALPENSLSTDRQCQSVSPETISHDQLLAVHWSAERGESLENSTLVRNTGENDPSSVSPARGYSTDCQQHHAVASPCVIPLQHTTPSRTDNKSNDLMNGESITPNPIWSHSDGERNAQEYFSRYERVSSGVPAPPCRENPPSYTSLSDNKTYDITSELRETASANACGNSGMLQFSALRAVGGSRIRRNTAHDEDEANNIVGSSRRHTMSEMETTL